MYVFTAEIVYSLQFICQKSHLDGDPLTDFLATWLVILEKPAQ